MLTDIDINKKANGFWKITVAPTVEPVSIEEVKLLGRIDGNNEDNLIASFITASRQKIEDYLGRAFLEQTIELFLDYWKEKIISLPRPPLLGVTDVVLLDEGGTEIEFGSVYYYEIRESIPGKLVIKKSASLPFNQSDRECAGYKITYTAGYGTNPEQVPRVIRNAIEQFAVYKFEKRIDGDEIPPEILKNIRSLRVTNR